jgi:hypothetical protein
VSNFILRESPISPQKKHTDYLHLFSAEGAKTPIFVAESSKSPKNVAADSYKLVCQLGEFLGSTSGCSAALRAPPSSGVN